MKMKIYPCRNIELSNFILRKYEEMSLMIEFYSLYSLPIVNNSYIFQLILF